uniref:Protein lap4 n=1 Tax=Lygus hesperus TaxID=30085 RepID=A0A0A9XFW4_LYGHE
MISRTYLYNTIHKTAVWGIVCVTLLGSIDLYLRIRKFREKKKDWATHNPLYKQDPYFILNANYMRFMKKDEEEIVLTRPLYYTALTIREKYGIPLQPPYLPTQDALIDMNGKLVEDTSPYMVFLRQKEQEREWVSGKCDEQVEQKSV